MASPARESQIFWRAEPLGERIRQTDIAKGIGIILVVIGHSFPDSTQLADGSLAQILYRLIYSFHMPFFFFISGLVSSGIVGCGGRREKAAQIKKKAMRLLVPYFVFGAIFIPLRIVFAEFARFSYDFSKLYTVFLGNNPCGQLWFLYVLFLYSIVAILFTTKKNIRYFTIGTLVLAIISPFVTLRYDGIAWSNVLFMSFFYYLGLYISGYHDKLYDKIKPKLIFAVLPAYALSFAALMLTNQHNYAKLFTSLAGIYIMLCVSELIHRHSDKLSNALKEIGGYSMDVYIFHSPMGIFWRILLLKLLHLSAGIYMSVYIIAGILGSYAISKFIVRRIPILRTLFLGMPFKKKNPVSEK